MNIELLSRKLKEKRVANRLSLRQVENATGISFSTIKRIEDGYGTPGVETVAKLCSWLDIPLQKIIENAPTPMHIIHNGIDKKTVMALIKLAKVVIINQLPEVG